MKLNDQIADLIDDERAKREATSCCNGTGACGDRECQIDAAYVAALAAAANIARRSPEGATP